MDVGLALDHEEELAIGGLYGVCTDERVSLEAVDCTSTSKGTIIGRVYETEEQSLYTPSSYTIDEATLSNSGYTSGTEFTIVGVVDASLINSNINNTKNTYKIGDKSKTVSAKWTYSN